MANANALEIITALPTSREEALRIAQSGRPLTDEVALEVGRLVAEGIRPNLTDSGCDPFAPNRRRFGR